MVTRRSYAALGLFWNPFGCVEHSSWPALVVPSLDLDALAERLREPGFAVVLRGEMGRGKSTHLRSLHARHFAALPYTYLGEDARPRTAIPRAPVCFVDEVQRLAPRARRRLFRRGRALALTSHTELRTELEAAGYTILERTLAGLDLPRLRAIVERRLAWAAREPGLPLEIPSARLAALLEVHGDDLRAITSALYDEIEDRRVGKG
jgi:hypothetical protein